MDNSFQTSFIPKRPIENNGISDKRPINPFTLVSVIVLVIVLLTTGGLYLYKLYLNNHKQALSDSLAKARDSFEKEKIDELELFNKRIEVSKQILGKHIVLSPMMSLLGEITIPTVQFTKFEHQTTENGVLVKMQGLARDYKSIALQSEMFNSPKGRYFKNVIFSNLIRNNVSTSGNNYINFDVEFNVEPSLMSYEINPPTENNSVISTNPVVDPNLTTTPAVNNNPNNQSQ